MYDLSYQDRVQSNGDVTLFCPLLLKSICNMNINKFPFDTQNFTLRIGSWTYDSSVLNLEWVPLTLKDPKSNFFWSV